MIGQPNPTLPDEPGEKRIESVTESTWSGESKPEQQAVTNGIGLPITEEPSHPTERTDRVLGE